MSNTSFNFLSDSLLFNNSREEFMTRELEEINAELDNYRSYLKENQDALNEECINGEQAVVISDFIPLINLPEIKELTRTALYMHQYVLDDPLYSISFHNLDIMNKERVRRGSKALTDKDVKAKIFGIINYMRELLPGVRNDVQYIKFYPFSEEPKNIDLDKIHIPDLSFPEEYPEIFKWMKERIVVRKVNEQNELEDITEPCQKLGITFRNDTGYPIILPVQSSHFLIPGVGLFDLPYNPSQEEFDNWVSEEVIKTIRDRYDNLMKRNSKRVLFGGVIAAETEFEREFMSSIMNREVGQSTDLKAYKIVTSLELPSLAELNFSDAMDIRKYFDQEFENFRSGLQDDIVSLRDAENEEEVKHLSAALSEKYEREIKTIEDKLKYRFNLKNINLIPAGASITTLFYTAEPVLLGVTGLHSLYELFQGFAGDRKEAKKNDCIFLHKLKH